MKGSTSYEFKIIIDLNPTKWVKNFQKERKRFTSVQRMKNLSSRPKMISYIEKDKEV